MNTIPMSIANILVGLGLVVASLNGCGGDPGGGDAAAGEEEEIVPSADAGTVPPAKTQTDIPKPVVDAGSSSNSSNVDAGSASESGTESDSGSSSDSSAASDAATATDAGAASDAANTPDGGGLGQPCVILGPACPVAFPFCISPKLNDPAYCTKLCSTNADCPAASGGCGNNRLCKK